MRCSEKRFAGEEVDALGSVGGWDNKATVAQVALAWRLGLPWVIAPIVGANSVAQLGELMMGACQVKLSTQEAECSPAPSCLAHSDVNPAFGSAQRPS